MKGLGFFALIIFSLNCLALETRNVSGRLYLDVPEKAITYVQFTVVGMQPDKSSSAVEKQKFIKTTQPFTPFSIDYKFQQIYSRRHYKLGVIIALDSSGDSILEKHEFEIPFDGELSDLNIKIYNPPEPIE